MKQERQGRQSQFLQVCSREDAIDRFHRMLDPRPLGVEQVALDAAVGRVLAEDLLAGVSVPAFDRANVDGFAVRSVDTRHATPERPVCLQLTGETITPGVVPEQPMGRGVASIIATGGMLPRGADAVVLVERSEVLGQAVWIETPVNPGAFVTYAGSDLAFGETVLYGGQLLGTRDIGLIAAVGLAEVLVLRRPRVAILSTGNELVSPGSPARVGGVFDSNAAILAAAVRDAGCEPVPLGIVPDRGDVLREALRDALQYDAVLLSGGTSKGEGDIAHRVVAELDDPGVIVHGVAVRPGKPLCLAVQSRRPVAVLPGFPTSAIFTYQEFVAPVLRSLAGMPSPQTAQRLARLPVPLSSELGRTDYRMVGLVRRPDGELLAYPMPRESGAVTTFSRADGFVAVPANVESLPAGDEVSVQLLDASQEVADLTVIGSHCTGLDVLLGRLQREGFRIKVLHVGSTGGLIAARNGDCDIAGIHLLDAVTDTYNVPLVPGNARLLPGYLRLQGLVFRADDPRFGEDNLDSLLPRILDNPDCVMVNRNAGSGTRLLLERLLGDARPPGYTMQPSSHNAVAVAVAQHRADWGVTIRPVADAYGLGFLPVREEHYDFVVPRERWERPAVRRFRELLADETLREELRERGFTPSD